MTRNQSKVTFSMQTDSRLPETPSRLLAPWLGATTTAMETWIGFWTAMMPRQQAAMVAEFQRQALNAWTAPFALALQAPARREPPAPAPRAPEAAEPRIATPPVMAPVIEAVAETVEPDAAEPDATGKAEAEPARGSKPARAAAQLRQTPPRKAAARKALAARKPAGRASAAKPARRPRR
jgi:hypothetical protein